MTFALLVQLFFWVCVTVVSATGTRVHHRFARGECIDCGYDLSGLGKLPRCPECGRLYEQVPRETVTRYRVRRRAVAGAVTVVPLSALLLLVGAKLVAAAYLAVPVALGMPLGRVARLAASDAEGSALPAIQWVLVASAPLWLVRRRARHMEWRLVRAWAVWMVGVCGLSVLHSRGLWS